LHVAQNNFSRNDIIATEQRVLDLLQWQLNCVTACEAAAVFVFSEDNREELLSHARVFLLIGVSESAFVGAKPSVVALSSILSAFDTMKLCPLQWVSKMGHLVEFSVSPLSFLLLFNCVYGRSFCPRSNSTFFQPEVSECHSLMAASIFQHEPCTLPAPDVPCESPANITDSFLMDVGDDDLFSACQDHQLGKDLGFTISDFF
jgi:hypothetical protein